MTDGGRQCKTATTKTASLSPVCSGLEEYDNVCNGQRRRVSVPPPLVGGRKENQRNLQIARPCQPRVKPHWRRASVAWGALLDEWRAVLQHEDAVAGQHGGRGGGAMTSVGAGGASIPPARSAPSVSLFRVEARRVASSSSRSGASRRDRAPAIANALALGPPPDQLDRPRSAELSFRDPSGRRLIEFGLACAKIGRRARPRPSAGVGPPENECFSARRRKPRTPPRSCGTSAMRERQRFRLSGRPAARRQTKSCRFSDRRTAAAGETACSCRRPNGPDDSRPFSPAFTDSEHGRRSPAHRASSDRQS